MPDRPDHIVHWVDGRWVDAGVAPSFLAHLGLIVFAVLIVLLLLFYCLTRIRIVRGQTALVIERLGVPKPKPLYPGLHVLPPLQRVRKRINLEQIQAERESQVKTSDDAFIVIKWVVRFSVKPTDDAILAYVYKVEKPIDQLLWRVENELRQIIHSMTLNALYDQKDTISQRIIGDQAQNALETGLQIDDVVFEQPMPPAQVRDAMNNQIAAIARQKAAAAAEAEAERLHRVGLARAESESKELQGQGVAKERMAIARGFKDSFELMKDGLPEASSHEILALMQETIEADMISTASSSGRSTIIFVPTTMTANGALTDLMPLVAKDVEK